MILAELHLENYKQYEGEHTILFPSRGVIAVIGANGVGKTTLFEAIEWCLYNPRAIGNAEVPPRGGVGQTVVRLILEDAADGCRYVVERRLKRGVTSAEIYREEQPESPIVQGTRQVTDYVARRLIGLGHRAFVSTFFTRQKELSFFGDLKDTDRRREVGRLLGFETIREAQRLIGDERTLVRQEADRLRRQYEDESAGRDFPAEIATAEATIATAQATATAATEMQADAATAHQVTRADLERWRELERADQAVRQELARLLGERRVATARQEAEAAALTRLGAAEVRRGQLLPLAASEPERRAVVATFVADRQRWERRRETERERDRAEHANLNAVKEMERAVQVVGNVQREIPDWSWNAAAPDAAIAEAERLLRVAGDLDSTAAATRATAFARCRTSMVARDEARTKFGTYQRTLNGLAKERAALLADGDPRPIVAATQRQRETSVAAAKVAQAKAEAATAQIATFEKLARSLRAATASTDRCPTCQRLFSETETESALDGLQRAVTTEREREAALRYDQRQAETTAEQAEQARRLANDHLQQLLQVEARIAQGSPMVADANAVVDSLEAECRDQLQELALSSEPTIEQTEAARTYAATLAKIDQASTLLDRLTTDARRATSEREDALAALAELGPTSYEATAHLAAERALEQAVSALGQIAELAKMIAQRPEHEAAHVAATAEETRLAAEQSRVEAHRLSLGFDPKRLNTAIAAEEAALAATTRAATALRDAQEAIRNAQRSREGLVQERSRIVDLAIRAETKQRGADELDRMYREFSRFDQYVATKITPYLAEQTGDLLAQVTENKFDRVSFDDDYGLRIFDAEEAFPIADFSGGERDVAALCARLALSQVIGFQATRPPRFLVLDEVFGSLDPDRRANLLGTLGLLASTTEAFSQLFIISHVEDVRFSPIVEEVWRITEIDGVSRWENAAKGSILEEL